MAHPTVQNHVRHVLADALKQESLKPFVHELYFAARDYHAKVTVPLQLKKEGVSHAERVKLEARVKQTLDNLKAKGIRFIPFALDELCDAVSDSFR